MPETDSPGRTAVVTGATGTIGSAVVHKLVESGVRVALIARKRRRIERMQTHLPQGARTLSCPADVTSAYEIIEARERILDSYGPPDLLVCAAGVRRAAPFEEVIPADWRLMMSTNLAGTLHTVQIFAPDILRAGERGERADIVLIGTGTAYERQHAYSVFSSLGASVGQFAKHLRAEYGPRGVRVHHLPAMFTAGSFFATSNFGANRATSIHHDVIREMPEDVETISGERVADELEFMVSLPAHVNLASATIQPVGNR